MEQILKLGLRPVPAKVVTRHTISKTDNDCKMFSRLNGGRKKTDEPNPWFGRVILETTFGGLNLGTDYSSHVAGGAVRSGASDKKSEVKVETKTCWHVFENDFFETDKATRSKFYLKIQTSESTLRTSDFTCIKHAYIIDGKRYDKEQAQEILKGYLKPDKERKPTSTQIEAGVDDANKIFYILPNVEDIVEIEQGKYHYTK